MHIIPVLKTEFNINKWQSVSKANMLLEKLGYLDKWFSMRTAYWTSPPLHTNHWQKTDEG